MSPREIQRTESPIRQDILASGDLEANLAELSKRADWRDNGVLQQVMVAALFGDIEADTISADALVSANLSNRVFDGVALIQKGLSYDDSHSIPLPASVGASSRIAAATQKPYVANQRNCNPGKCGNFSERQPAAVVMA